MTDAPPPRGRRVVRVVVGWAFVVAVLVALVVGFRDDGPALVAALADAQPWAIVVAVLGAIVAAAGLLPVWRTLLAACGHPLALVDASRILFVGQLGKYLPGSVWSVGAQAALLRARAVPVRVALGVGALLILSQLLGAAGVVAVAGMLGAGLLGELPLVAAALLVVLLVPLVPAVLRLLVRLATGVRPTLTVRAWLVVCATLVATWALQTLAVVPLATGEGWTAATAGVAAAFAAAYAGGVVVLLAPAGLGVREGVLAALLAPIVGPGAALATALVTRLAAAVVDVVVAGASAWAGRRARP